MKEQLLLEGIFVAIHDLPPEEQQLALGAVEIVRRASLDRLRSSGM